MSKVRCQFFQCCIETLGSTSVKSGLCPSINITTVKSSSAAFLQANRLCGPRKTDSRGFNFNLSYFLNLISESAPKLKDPVKS